MLKTTQLEIVEDYGDLKIVKVPSFTDPNEDEHYVKLYEDGKIECTCIGYEHHGHCHHTDAFELLLGNKRIPRRAPIPLEKMEHDQAALEQLFREIYKEVQRALLHEAMKHLIDHEYITGDDLDHVKIIKGSRRQTTTIFRHLRKFGYIEPIGYVNSTKPEKHYQRHLKYRRIISRDDAIFNVSRFAEIWEELREPEEDPESPREWRF